MSHFHMNIQNIRRNASALILLVAVSFGVIPSVSYAQTATDPLAEAVQRVEKQLDKRRQELGVPGIGLAIVKDGRIFLSGIGLKDVDRKLAVTADTQFPIGSATKAFTGLSVLMTHEEKKLSIDDSPKKYLPYFKLRDPDADAKIKVRDLLSHSSGLNRTDLAMITGKLNRQELIRVAGEAKPTAKLREKFQYQNLMYAAAGEVVAQAQKTPWEKFVPARIFRPLGMTNSTMTVKDMVRAKDRSLGYEYNTETKVTRMLPYRPIDDVAPAGSINSSVRDMAKWVQFILNGGELNGTRLVSAGGFNEWTKPQQVIAGKTAYAFGWIVMEWNGMKVLQHGGNIDGFTSLVALIPEKNFGFVILANANGSQLPSEAMPQIFKEIVGEQAPPVVQTPSGAEKEAGKYRIEAAKLDIDVRFENGKLLMSVPGQPTYELQNTGGRKYRLGGAPDGFFATFTDSSMLLEQPQGNLTLPKQLAAAPVEAVVPKPTMSADELMAKALDAVGGEANWRKLTSREMLVDIDFEHQGVKGVGTVLAKAPYWYAADTKLTALGKPIGETFEYLNDSTGGARSSFSPESNYAGKRLNDLRTENSIYGLADWKKGLASYETKGLEKVGTEEVWVIEFKPESGTPYRLYLSAKTFLPLKRAGVIVSNTSSVQMPVTVLYEDYRDIDGVKIPFKTTTNTVGLGDVVTYVKQVKHNVALRDEAFRPKN